MPRPDRVEFPGAYHHVYVRGVRRGHIFTTDASRLLFLSLLAQLPGAYGVEVHAYVLMGNHYHFMAHSLEGRLSEAMHFLGSTYASWFNDHAGYEGSVFATRFHNRVVDAEVDWMHLLAYQHLNPYRAGLVSDIEAYPWSSLGAYLGREETPAWLTTAELLHAFGGGGNHRAYLDEVISGRELGPPDFHQRATWSPGTTGSTGLPTLVARPMEQGVLELERVLGGSGVHRGNGSELEKELSAWWLKRTTLASGRELVDLLGTSLSTVTRRVSRLEERRQRGEVPVRLVLDSLQSEALGYLRVSGR